MEGTGCSLGLWAPGSVRLSVALAFTFDFVAVEERPALVVDCIFERIFKLLPPARQTGSVDAERQLQIYYYDCLGTESQVWRHW